MKDKISSFRHEKKHKQVPWDRNMHTFFSEQAVYGRGTKTEKAFINDDCKMIHVMLF